MDTLTALQKVSLFRFMPPEFLRYISQVAIHHSFRQGDVLCTKGETGTALFVLLKGQVGVIGMDEEGREVLLNILSEGEVFGELSAIDGQRRSADVVALSNGEMLIVRQSDFVPLVQQMPPLAWQLLLILVKRLRETDELVMRMAWLNAKQRIAWALLEYAKGSKLPSWLTANILAKRCGLARETASRILNQLQKEGILRRTKEGTELVKPEELKAILKQAPPAD